MDTFTSYEYIAHGRACAFMIKRNAFSRTPDPARNFGPNFQATQAASAERQQVSCLSVYILSVLKVSLSKFLFYAPNFLEGTIVFMHSR